MRNRSVLLSYICAVIYSFSLVALCVYLYSNNEASLVGLILGLILSVVTGVAMGIGGFYLIVIPLPYISLGKGGCNKPYQPPGRKILCGVLSIMCPIMVFVVLFTTRNINLTFSSTFKKQDSGELLHEFSNKEQLPARILISDDGENKIYTYLLRHAGGASKKIASGKSIDEMDTIYTASKNSNIFEIDANINYIIWYESTLDDYSYIYQIKLYSRVNQTTKTIFEKTIDINSSEFPFKYLGLSGDKAFYTEFDLDNSLEKIIEYNITNSTYNTFIELPLINYKISINSPISFINVKESILTTSIIENEAVKLKVYNIDTKEEIYSINLPKNIELVYYGDFDLDTKTFAIYYSKNNSGDGVGVINIDEHELKEFYTLDSNIYLYHNKISISGNLVYYNIEKYISGYTIDHYLGVQYNINNNKYEEIKYAIYLELVNDELYAVCFDENVATLKINYYKYPITK